MHSDNRYESFDIRKSSKAYIDAPEHYIVIHNGTVYLRIVGREGSYAVMTATSGEDMGTDSAFGDQEALNEAAKEVAKQICGIPESKYDHHNRPYVKICECEFLSDAYRAAASLFEKLPARQSQPNPAQP